MLATPQQGTAAFPAALPVRGFSIMFMQYRRADRGAEFKGGRGRAALW
jgi:hypothetical protein